MAPFTAPSPSPSPPPSPSPSPTLFLGDGARLIPTTQSTHKGWGQWQAGGVLVRTQVAGRCRKTKTGPRRWVCRGGLSTVKGPAVVLAGLAAMAGAILAVVLPSVVRSTLTRKLTLV